jgi:hypothetical protein
MLAWARAVNRKLLGWPLGDHRQHLAVGPEFVRSDAADSLGLAWPFNKEAMSMAYNWPSSLRKMRCWAQNVNALPITNGLELAAATPKLSKSVPIRL